MWDLVVIIGLVAFAMGLPIFLEYVSEWKKIKNECEIERLRLECELERLKTKDEQ